MFGLPRVLTNILFPINKLAPSIGLSMGNYLIERLSPFFLGLGPVRKGGILRLHGGWHNKLDRSHWY